jgi:toluene monooxygenase system protein D
MVADRTAPNEVGPVLLAGRVAEAVVEAIRKQNPGVRILARGSYLRVAVANRCEVSTGAIEALLGEPFRLPDDLERVMPSFRGRLSLTEAHACWDAGPPPAAPGSGARTG